MMMVTMMLMILVMIFGDDHIVDDNGDGDVNDIVDGSMLKLMALMMATTRMTLMLRAKIMLMVMLTLR